MLHSAVSVLVVAQSSLEIPEGLMNNPVFYDNCLVSIIVHSLWQRSFMIFFIYVQSRL